MEIQEFFPEEVLRRRPRVQGFAAAAAGILLGAGTCESGSMCRAAASQGKSSGLLGGSKQASFAARHARSTSSTSSST
eukprot:scaffold182316_cov17-Tisochrysis_lutea.AAC.2